MDLCHVSVVLGKHHVDFGENALELFVNGLGKFAWSL